MVFLQLWHLHDDIVIANKAKAVVASNVFFIKYAFGLYGLNIEFDFSFQKLFHILREYAKEGKKFYS